MPGIARYTLYGTLAALALLVHAAPRVSAQTIVGPRWAPVPATNPPAERHAHGAIHDLVRRRLVVFGGEVAGVATNDVWALPLAGPPDWSEIQTTGGPPPERSDMSAVYDYRRDRLVIFGGESGFSGYRFSDTWALSFATNTWTQISTGGPCPRSGHYAVYDGDNDRMLVYGGKNSDVYMFDEYPDTWSFSFASNRWTQVSRTRDPNPLIEGNPCVCRQDNGSGTCPGQPTRRQYGVAIYDPLRHRMLIHGGWYSGVTLETFDETWAYPKPGADTVWAFLDATGVPPNRQNHRGAYDSRRDRLVVFGGTQEGPGYLLGPYNSTFQLGLLDNTWTELQPSGTLPAAREYHGAVFDSIGDRMIVFGGSPAADTIHSLNFNDTWELDFDTTPPAAVTDLGQSVGCTAVELSWTAPGDDGAAGTAAAYDLRRSWSPITEQSFGSATVIPTGAPGPSGSAEHATVVLGACSRRAYFAIKTRDEVGNLSAISNVIFAATPCDPYCDDGGGFASRRVSGSFELEAPVPNPAETGTLITYSIPGERAGERIRLVVHDLAGRRVRTLEEGRASGGRSAIAWDLLGENGQRVPSGMYFIRLTISTEVRARSLLVAR